MENNPVTSFQSAGAVRPSITSYFFGQVRNAVNDRLDSTFSRPNSAAGIIAAGPASRPTATLSNGMAAEVTSFSPPVGRTLARTMHLKVQNTPGSRVDSVADAIQRYLDIKPRNEPTADPLDEDSVARHPQQVTQAAGRWQNELFYQFSANGLYNLQTKPQFRTWSGHLDLEIENPGPTGVFAPPSRSQVAGRSVFGPDMGFNPTFAAQQAVAATVGAAETGGAKIFYSGPPLYRDDPYFDPNYVAANVMGSMRLRLAEPSALESIDTGVDASLDSPVVAAGNAMANMAQSLFVPQMQWLDFGPADLSEQPGFDPVTAAYAAINTYREATAPDQEGRKVGPATYAEDPDQSPATAGRTSMQSLMASMVVPEMQWLYFGPPDMSDKPILNPVTAGREAVAKFQKAIAPAPELNKAGARNYIDDPASNPEQAWAETITATRDRLEVVPTHKIKVGRPVYTEDMYTNPVRSGPTVTQVNVGLSTALMPDRADSYKPRVLDEPFVRVLRTIADLNGLTERMSIIGTKA